MIALKKCLPRKINKCNILRYYFIENHENKSSKHSTFILITMLSGKIMGLVLQRRKERQFYNLFKTELEHLTTMFWGHAQRCNSKGHRTRVFTDTEYLLNNRIESRHGDFL